MILLLYYYILTLYFPDVVCAEKNRWRPHRRRPSTGLRSLVVRSTDVVPKVFQTNDRDFDIYIFEVIGIILDFPVLLIPTKKKPESPKLTLQGKVHFF